LAGRVVEAVVRSRWDSDGRCGRRRGRRHCGRFWPGTSGRAAHRRSPQGQVSIRARASRWASRAQHRRDQFRSGRRKLRSHSTKASGRQLLQQRQAHAGLAPTDRLEASPLPRPRACRPRTGPAPRAWGNAPGDGAPRGRPNTPRVGPWCPGRFHDETRPTPSSRMPLVKAVGATTTGPASASGLIHRAGQRHQRPDADALGAPRHKRRGRGAALPRRLSPRAADGGKYLPGKQSRAKSPQADHQPHPPATRAMRGAGRSRSQRARIAMPSFTRRTAAGYA